MKPCVLIGSCHHEIIPPERIVKGILQVESDADLTPSQSSINDVDVTSYSWSIKTKYYEADVNICTMSSRSLGSKEFAEAVNAVIICFDSCVCDDLSLVQQWLPFVKEFEPEIKILVCECCSTTAQESQHDDTQRVGIDKVSVQKWCVKHGFELVELSPLKEEEDDDDVEDDFPESLGMSRIIQALHAHLWPNLTLLEKKRPQYELEESEPDPDPPGAACQNNEESRSNQQKSSSDSSLTNNIDSILEDTLNGTEETFEELFGKLSEMKLKTEGMSFEERRAYAEKMAISFWKSMGGNDSEIEGLSSEED